MTKLFYAAIIAAFVNNLVLTQSLGMDSFIRNSKDLATSVRIAVSVLIVTVVSSLITWPIGRYVLDKLQISFLSTILFLLVEAALVWFVLFVMKKISVHLYDHYKELLALVIINSAVLGIILNNVEVGYSFIRSTVFSIFGGVGFGIAMILMAGVREKIKYNDIPGPFEGVPILLVTAGLMSIAFYGFTGLLL
ncbi:MAG: electron transport complex subunit RsxA [Lachnospiraceae bacterium]|nr:electron transport complex subunit RsxA [Lachnospiraceae bacterium]MBR2842216.1 electron transport complex subunit RsxA [Lachnospiraceae bacterium]MBR3359867.1 electron transport complex subunit RsxA [Lachnospiraceae bacterium]MBR6357061.1 electron transport complex subunit RsxA [Lachnospiraceae bacterium]MBR7076815.1 electron transport complex subunit RsxA [Lachnospiraceae bacterium]